MLGTVCPRRNIVITEADDLEVGAGRPSLRVNRSQGMFGDFNRSDRDTYTMHLILKMASHSLRKARSCGISGPNAII